MNKKIKFLLAFLIISTSSFAQSIISGVVLDKETLKPIHNVNIRVADNSLGTTSMINGVFELQINKSKVKLIFSSIGYDDKIIPIKTGIKDMELGYIYLESQPYSIDEILINAGVRNEKDLPINVSSISSHEIDVELGGRPLPMILQNTPGVFSVRNGGGSGDANLSIRGFHQENISLLLNGIPINGEENGLVYWSNWLGLSNSAAEIQIQKGAGLANASIYAIGGSINIITQNSQKEKSGSINFKATSYGNFSTNIALNSGLLKNGWNTSLMISLGTGTGYVDATFVNSFSYFFTAHKKISDKHNLVITLLGAPQKHGQRTLKLSNEEVKINGLTFNKDWGSHNGMTKNASVNFYHKPFLSINDEFKINEKQILSTSIYFSVGHGGGRWSESFNYSPSIFSYRNYSGQIDWNTIYENNATNEQAYTLENGETVTGYSLNTQTNFLASHIQTGLMSNYEYKVNSNISFLAGLHYRYFNSYVREEIDDLLGGKFFIEDYSWSLAGVSGRNQIKTVGDIIKVDNNSIINFASLWAQLVYKTNRINSYVSLSTNSNWYQRVDRFNYISNTNSEIVNKFGFDIRTGLTFIVNEHQNIYINGSYISRAPYFKYVFGNYTNVIVQDLKNETAKSIELGYKLNNRRTHLTISAYITERNNISMLSNEYVQLEDNNQTRAMINGLSALNSGAEIEIQFEVNRKLKLGGWLSMGNFKWQNNVSANLFNDNNIVVDTINVFTDGLYIGGTAQNQAGIFADIIILNTFYFKAEFQYFDKLYSNFDPTSRNNPNDQTQPYQLPSYGVINAYLGMPFEIGKNYGRIQINAFNLLNNKYIVTGEDGVNHDLESFRGFWSFGRNLSFSLKFNF